MTDSRPNRTGIWEYASAHRRVVAISIVVVGLLVVGIVFLQVARPWQPSSRSVSGPSASSTVPPVEASPTPSPSVQPDDGEATPAPSPDSRFGEPIGSEVPIDQPAESAEGVIATIQGVESFEVTGTGVGEVSGPAVRLSIEVRNGSSDGASLDQIAVNAYYGADAIPAAPMTSEPSSVAFTGVLPPGEASVGVYVFSVPAGSSDELTVTVSLSAGNPILVFG